MYEKDQVLKLGDAVFEVGVAFSDGVQITDDSDEVLAVIPALLGAANEFKEDLPAALMHLGSELLEKGADLKRLKAEQGTGG